MAYAFSGGNMIRTLEKIQISDTTTSYRVAIDEVNSGETLDERYHRHREAIETTENTKTKDTETEPAQPSVRSNSF
jgi:hypothetical protein